MYVSEKGVLDVTRENRNHLENLCKEGKLNVQQMQKGELRVYGRWGHTNKSMN